MKIIAHRGNLSGPTQTENHPDQIKKALDLGFDVEIDVWYKENKVFLGHDFPQYLIGLSWLDIHKNKLWIHLKNIECILIFKNTDFNYFWHETDKVTLTSKGIPWCYPGIEIDNGISVLQHKNQPKTNVYGICTDYPTMFA